MRDDNEDHIELHLILQEISYLERRKDAVIEEMKYIQRMMEYINGSLRELREGLCPHTNG